MMGPALAEFSAMAVRDLRIDDLAKANVAGNQLNVKNLIRRQIEFAKNAGLLAIISTEMRNK